MITITGRKVAVVPIYDPDEIVKVGALSVSELEYIKRTGMKNENNTSRIIVPEQAKERTDQGIVKYIGPKVRDTKPGDYVFYPNYAGTLMQIEGEGTLIIMPEQFLTCKYLMDEELIIPGLFFQSRISYTHNQTTNAYRDEFIPATYEQAVNLIAQSFTEFHKTLQARERGRLTPEQMDQLTAGAGVDD